MRRLLAILALIPLAACTHSEHEMKKIDTELEVKGQSGDEKVGLNKDGEAVLQQERDAADELTIQRSANAYLVERLRTDHHELKRCIKDISDPRIGGKGDWGKIPDVDSLRRPTESNTDMGVDEQGNLKVVKKTYFRNELKAERQYEASLRSMQTLVQEQLERCNFELGLARNKAGLPTERYTAEGYFTNDGTWVETRKGERNVSDAIEIQAKNKKRAENKANQRRVREAKSVETTIENSDDEDRDEVH